MPLFGSRNSDDVAVEPVEEPALKSVEKSDARRLSFFSRHQRPLSPDSTASLDGYNEEEHVDHTGWKAGLFGRHRSSSSSDDSMSTARNSTPTVPGSGASAGASSNKNRSFFDVHTRGGSRLHRSGSPLANDPASLGARQKVSDAEKAERQADCALGEARTAVREARQHVKNLEHEAEEDARLAKLKQQEAKIVSKSAKGLGRHG
ncbi:hypothetical protein DFH11DRAFT_1542584 [Phellopilus nigrolimitatus]|nr:hypothetical protein DFH11DRAFT_1542584 [Phellopilus nigrolimitatus]